MIRRFALAAVLACTALTAAPVLTAQSPAVTLRAPTMLDGRGGSRTDAMVTVSGGRITAVGAASGAPTYDLTGLTLLPGFIDTHVHIGWHFDANGRYQSGPEPADQAALYGAENAYVTLMAGFTTVQSVGAASDKPRRWRVASFPGRGCCPRSARCPIPS
jgi:imidazolonepropionase-like amidohydrolase